MKVKGLVNTEEKVNKFNYSNLHIYKEVISMT